MSTLLTSLRVPPVRQIAVSGPYLTGGGNLSNNVSIGLVAGTSGTSNLVARDGSGNFSTNQITATKYLTTSASPGALSVTSSRPAGMEIIAANSAGQDAGITFHNSGQYAVHFGLSRTTNKLSVGGWSLGANVYEIYHSGNVQPSAATWTTARTLTIGRTGKSVNGGSNVSWSAGEIGNTNSAANSLAVRDGAGDLHVRLIRAEHQNQSNIYGAMAFRGAPGAGTDNYIRFCNNPTAIRTWLGAAAEVSGGAVPSSRRVDSGGPAGFRLAGGGDLTANRNIHIPTPGIGTNINYQRTDEVSFNFCTYDFNTGNSSCRRIRVDFTLYKPGSFRMDWQQRRTSSSGTTNATVYNIYITPSDGQPSYTAATASTNSTSWHTRTHDFAFLLEGTKVTVVFSGSRNSALRNFRIRSNQSERYGYFHYTIYTTSQFN